MLQSNQVLSFIRACERGDWSQPELAEFYRVEDALTKCGLFGIGTKALVWGFFCQEVRQCNACLPSSVSLFDLKARFFPDPQQGQGRRAQGAVKVGRRTKPFGMLRSCEAIP